MKAGSRKLTMTAGPAKSRAGAEPRKRPVPIEPPTATMAIWLAVSWWRSPCSSLGLGVSDTQHVYQKRVQCPNGARQNDLRNGGGVVLHCCAIGVLLELLCRLLRTLPHAGPGRNRQARCASREASPRTQDERCVERISPSSSGRSGE